MNHAPRLQIILTAGTLLAVSAGLPAQFLCGDCNDDGVVNITDALVAAQHATGLISLVPPEFQLCNVTGIAGGPPGGAVDILDALILAKKATGLTVTAAWNTEPACTITSPTSGTHTDEIGVVFDALDPDGKIPEFKFCAVRVERLTADSPSN